MRDLERWIDALDNAAKFFEGRDDMHLVGKLEEVAQFLVALTETGPPRDMSRPMLVWIDYDVAVYGDHGDGWLSVDGDAALADYLTEEE